MAKSEPINNRLNEVNKKSINIRIILCTINGFWIRKTKIKLVRDLWISEIHFYFCQRYSATNIEMDGGPMGISELVHEFYSILNFPDIQFNLFSARLDTKGKSVFIDKQISTLIDCVGTHFCLPAIHVCQVNWK